MENRKTQIVDLALKLIREKGYVAISYDDFSKQLGVTKASIHYHFEKKEDLGIAVLERILNSLQNIVNSSGTAEEKLKHYIAYRTEKIGCNEICPISSFQTDFESLPDVLQQKVQAVSQLEVSLLITILQEGINEDFVQDSEDIESLALTILACIKGILQYRRVLGKDIYPQVINQINRLFVKRI
ncbi:TetR/AcrR family transcriptional regulator [Paenibacillus sp. Soil724D2]|uniref:TetR/AcrR family transcriptional regulator n=1 Tax=Paenibacillus sp. (strain Soil724D2) TaxID=1736392 RepID=UPI000714A36F|nr:TetR/AcrR family transcriptional regulator [Paenibacillus sp. Soil724D2]KRE36614.1 TetR family transcriptional regulator [Paenibacillus sp. Soil724D2]